MQAEPVAPGSSGRTPSCPWAWRDPEDGNLHTCERKPGHKGAHAWTVEWNDHTEGAFRQGYDASGHAYPRVSAPARVPS